MTRLPRLIPLLVLALALLGAGCAMETRVVSNTWADNFGDIADPKPVDQPGLDPTDPRVRSPQGYAVELTRFTGADATGNAVALTSRLREQAGLADLWYTEGSVASTVYAGRFRDPRDERAQAMLRHVRAAQLDGGRPFAQAKLVPLSGAGTGEAVYNELDLRNYRGSITLQVGFYDVNYGPNFRAAAEQAVATLRADGEEAYFYHGPNRSLITVGLFTRAEALVPNGQTEMYSPAVKRLQERFPYNTMNGLTFERRENGVGGVQESFLVPVR
jgi:hypothetical protein